MVQQLDPIYVEVTQSSAELLKLKQALASGALGAAGTAVSLTLEDGSTYQHKGTLQFSEVSVDASTGSVVLRAEFANPDQLLLPGMYVRVRLEQAKAGNAITLPQQAVTRSAQGDTVSVVDAEGKIAKRNVKVGGQQNGRWVILDGLKAGEQVMVDGFQKLQMMPPGTAVKAVPWQANGSATAAAAAPAPAAAK